MIILHDSSYSSSTTHMGYGEVSDALSCEVTEELNGEYTLEMIYPVQGRRFDNIQVRNVLLVTVNPDDSTLQPFRIMSVSKPLDGKITVRANHISYDLSGYIIAPVILTGTTPVATTLSTIFAMPGPPNPFTPYTDKTTQSAFVNRFNSSIRNCLAGRRGSVLDKYGGEFEWDNFTVNLWNHRGNKNSGVRIEYAKNLTGLDVDTDASNVYSHVQAYWYDQDTHEESHGSRVATGASGLERTLVIDATEDFSSKPTATKLTEYTTDYVSTHDLTAPTISVSANFVDLSQSEEYKNYRNLERVALGDTVTVYHAGLGVNITTRVRKTVFDVLRDRFVSLKLGNIRAGIVDQIVSNQVVAKNAMTAVQTMTYINNEMANYLPLAGGTMTGKIDTEGQGGAYWRGRDYALTKTTTASTSSYFYPVTSIKTQSGTWDVGTYGEKLVFHYQTDSDYSGQSNTSATYTIDIDGSYSGTAGGGGPTLPLIIAEGGTGATTAASALANLFSTVTSWSAPSVGTYASSVVEGGYVQYGKLVIVNLTVKARSTAIDGTGSNMTFLMGLPSPSVATPLAVCRTSQNYLQEVQAYVATNGRINFLWNSGIQMQANAQYRLSGVYLTA